MAGKKKISDKRTENRGGKRDGAGRPTNEISAQTQKKWEREIKERAKREGKTLIGVLLDIAYAKIDGIDCRVNVRAMALR